MDTAFSFINFSLSLVALARNEVHRRKNLDALQFVVLSEGILIEQGPRTSKMPSYNSHPGLSGTQTRLCSIMPQLDTGDHGRGSRVCLQTGRAF